jgi:hypothetical protein
MDNFFHLSWTIRTGIKINNIMKKTLKKWSKVMKDETYIFKDMKKIYDEN